MGHRMALMPVLAHAWAEWSENCNVAEKKLWNLRSNPYSVSRDLGHVLHDGMHQAGHLHPLQVPTMHTNWRKSDSGELIFTMWFIWVYVWVQQLYF